MKRITAVVFARAAMRANLGALQTSQRNSLEAAGEPFGVDPAKKKRTKEI